MAHDEDDGQSVQGYLVVENPRGASDSFLARRLGRSQPTVHPEAMARDGAPSAEGASRPALLRYDYFQTEMCGPHLGGLPPKLRRAPPRHLRAAGVSAATWAAWMERLAAVQAAEPYPAVGMMPAYAAQCFFLGDLGLGPQLLFNSLACCDGYSFWCKEYQQGMREWLEMVNRELPSPMYAKIISYRICGTWAWVLEIATTEAAAAQLREKAIFTDAVPWGNFRGGDHKEYCPPGARAMYGRYA